MQIKLLYSWIREYLETQATAKQIADVLSLSSVSVERIEPLGRDYLLDIEVTTNRPDLMSVKGIAREAAAALKSEGIQAKFVEKKLNEKKELGKEFPVEIVSNEKLVNRICAATLSVEIKNSPQIIKDRLEASDIRSLNNVVDVTNYVMREVGHPMHAFDLDKLGNKLTIREGKTGEKIVTLDKKEYELSGGEIVAINQKNEIVDLLGIMGTLNSAVDENTKKILLFVDNNDPHRIRRASMNLAIRTDAAILNEKGVDPELAYSSLMRGVELLEQIADGKLESPVIDLYPNKVKSKTIEVSIDKIRAVMGIDISEKQVESILNSLSFKLNYSKGIFTITPPSNRERDVEIAEDIIEEVARVYGYHKIPSQIPSFESITPHNYTDRFFWEKKTKTALKYWGFVEVYTPSLISEDMLEVAVEDAVKLSNPLGENIAYMRTTLIPGLLQAVRNNTRVLVSSNKQSFSLNKQNFSSNKSYDAVKIFELSNVYYKRKEDLPHEILMLSGVIKQENNSFLKTKGIIEGLFDELGIKKYEFNKRESGDGANILVFGNILGEVEILDGSVVDFEINFSQLLKYVSNKKTYTPISKFPPAVEDLRIKIDENIEYSKIISSIKKASTLVADAFLLDAYEDKKTFRIIYQSLEKNLTANDIKEERDKIIHNLKTDIRAELA